MKPFKIIRRLLTPHFPGRTARIGNEGLATSLYNHDRDVDFAPGLVKILTECNQEIPDFLEDQKPAEGQALFDDDDTDNEGEENGGGGDGWGSSAPAADSWSAATPNDGGWGEAPAAAPAPAHKPEPKPTPVVEEEAPVKERKQKW